MKKSAFFPSLRLFPAITALLVISACAGPEPDITGKEAVFLVPENFRGFVHIHPNEACGESAEKIKDARLFKIPDDGVLISQHSPILSMDFERMAFNLVDGSGHRSPLPYYRQNVEADDQTVLVFVTEFGDSHSMGLDFNCLRAFIGTKPEIKAAFSGGKPQKGTEKALEKLKKCREGK